MSINFNMESSAGAAASLGTQKGIEKKVEISHKWSLESMEKTTGIIEGTVKIQVYGNGQNFIVLPETMRKWAEGKKLAIYLGKNGKSIAFAADEGGLVPEEKNFGKGKSVPQLYLSHASTIRALKEKGTPIPCEFVVEYDREQDAWGGNFVRDDGLKEV